MQSGEKPAQEEGDEKIVPIRPGMTNQVSPKMPRQTPKGAPRQAKHLPKGRSRPGPNQPPEATIAKLKDAVIKAGASPVEKIKKARPKRDPNSLTSKQEAFAVAYVAGANASDAYRAAYNTANYKPSTIHEQGCRMLANPKLHARIQALRDELAKRTFVTIESLTDELEEAMTMARETKQAAIMIQAVQAKAKLHGLMVEKVEQKTNYVVEAPPQDATTEDWLAAVTPKAG